MSVITTKTTSLGLTVSLRFFFKSQTLVSEVIA